MKISTQIIIGFTFTLVIIAVITGTFYIEKNRFENNIKMVLRTSEVLKSSSQLQKIVVDIETGFRGYLLTGKKEFLEPYITGMDFFSQEFNIALHLVKENPSQQKSLRDIKKKLIDWDNFIAKPLILSKEMSLGSDSAELVYERLLTEKFRSGVGIVKMDNIRNEFEKFDETEFELENERDSIFDQQLIKINRVFIALMILAILFVIILTIIISRSITSRISKLVDLSENLAEGKFDLNKTHESDDELRPLEESLKLAASRLNEAFSKITVSNQELDQFAYVVSHDLKAPLRAMSSLASWIQEDLGSNISDEVKNHIVLLKSRIIRMEGLINGLLEYSRIGKGKIENEVVDVSQLLKHITSDLSITNSVKVNIQDGMPVFFTPKLRLGQVFQNLIDNAVRYGKTSQPKIDITCKELDHFYQFSIADNGPGIAPAYHEKIFVIFQTLEARDKIESTGIGLSIVKKVVEDMGGKIKVESESGKGAKFIFTWPKA